MEQRPAAPEGGARGARKCGGEGATRRRRGRVSRRRRARVARQMARQSQGLGKGTVHLSGLAGLAKGLAGGKIKVGDLTETLSPAFPPLPPPPGMGPARPFRATGGSHYDERGP